MAQGERKTSLQLLFSGLTSITPISSIFPQILVEILSFRFSSERGKAILNWLQVAAAARLASDGHVGGTENPVFQVVFGHGSA